MDKYYKNVEIEKRVKGEYYIDRMWWELKRDPQGRRTMKTLNWVHMVEICCLKRIHTFFFSFSFLFFIRGYENEKLKVLNSIK